MPPFSGPWRLGTGPGRTCACVGTPTEVGVWVTKVEGQAQAVRRVDGGAVRTPPVLHVAGGIWTQLPLRPHLPKPLPL